ncbi:MAG: M48 family metallopeptidase [Candidatus Auribacterota bacterium]
MAEPAESTVQRAERAKQYERVHDILFAVDIIYTFGLMILFIATGGTGGWSARLLEWIETWCASYWLQIAVYMGILTAGYMALLLPLSFYSGFILEHKYDLSNETVGSWIKDKLKSFALNLIFMIALGEIMFFFFDLTETTWWLWAGLIWVLFGVVLSNLAPVLIIPLFYKLKPLDNPTLTDKLVSLAERVHAKILGVFEIELSSKTKKANAALTGLGNTKRILLGDTLLKNFDHEEIEVILAHELGHYYYKHIWKLIGFGGIITIGGLYLTSIALSSLIGFFGYDSLMDIASFPLFLMCMFAFALVTMPFNSTYSRMLEKQADLFALRETGKPEHFISSMRKLAELNLANENPNPVIEFLTHSHPSIGKRVLLAEKFAAENNA